MDFMTNLNNEVQNQKAQAKRIVEYERMFEVGCILHIHFSIKCIHVSFTNIIFNIDFFFKTKFLLAKTLKIYKVLDNF